ncbi:hypothetical protein [Streptomyces flaveolus]|uniref:hypothetical protein n=1 Tax=Streptomyces flaveolus TaxID=67297 RepID=UPI00368B91D8
MVQLDRHARLEQARRVVDVLVAVRVELRAGDAGRRQARQVFGAGRRGVLRGGCEPRQRPDAAARTPRLFPGGSVKFRAPTGSAAGRRGRLC